MAKNNIPTRSRWSHEAWFSTHTGYERPADRRKRINGIDSAEPTAARPGGQPLRHRQSRYSHTDAPIAATSINNNTKDEKQDINLLPGETKDKQQSRQRERRKRKARGRRKKDKREDPLTSLHRPPEGYARTFKDAGLPSKGL